MTNSATNPAPERRFVATWPAAAIGWSVGLFCAAVLGLWLWDHVVTGSPVDETGWIVLAATVLRAGTVVVALASVRGWGRRLPGCLVHVGLWGCASAQLVYPFAESVAKLLVLAGVVTLPPTGIGNLGTDGWFNLAMAWLVFGVPGLLFVLAARSWAARHDSSRVRAVAGLLLGVVALFGIGALVQTAAPA